MPLDGPNPLDHTSLRDWWEQSREVRHDHVPVRLGEHIYSYKDERTLICPRCGSEYLHQGKVTVYDRGEDANDIRLTVVDGRNVTTRMVPNDGSGNPSARRHGLSIEFSCEECDEPIELTISQHKGVTLVGWRGNHR